MTQVIDGIAQPDIVAWNEEEFRFIFVETEESLGENREALKAFVRWYEDADAVQEYIENCIGENPGDLKITATIKLGE